MNNFDKGISIRMVVLGAVVGHLAGVARRWQVPTEVVDAVGALAGYAYDLLAFQVKSRIRVTKPAGRV